MNGDKPIVQVRRVVMGPISTNCWIVKCIETGRAMVVDPGGSTNPLIGILAEMGVSRLELILNTHGHFDHVWGNGELSVPTMIHRLDAGMLSMAAQMAASWGYAITPPPEPARLLEEGDSVEVGRLSFSVIHTPGHSPGSICLLGHGILISGDTLFLGSIGRTDLPGSDPDAMENTLLEKIIPLDENLRVLPGHGPETTMKREKLTNPFLR